MEKRVLTLLIGLLFIVQFAYATSYDNWEAYVPVVEEVQESFKFKDVPDDVWYKDALYALYQMDCIEPDMDSNFNGNIDISYMDFVSWLIHAGRGILANTEGLEDNKLNTVTLLEFMDMLVLNSHWKTTLIRLDALRFIQVFISVCDIELEDINKEFQVSDYMQDLDSLDVEDFSMVESLFYSGIVIGSDLKLNGNSNITRAEAATLLYRVLNKDARVRLEKSEDIEWVSLEDEEPKRQEFNFDKVFGIFITTATNNMDRNFNIDLAAKSIDGKVVYPGEIFSFYKVSGKHGKAEGYKIAGIISGGVHTTGYGGGVCQVVTTLYNSVLLSNLEILERKNHSFKSDYVEFGRDATFASGLIDFRFRNTYNVPIKISAKFNNSDRTITVVIYGDSNIELPYVNVYTKGSGHKWIVYREVDGNVNYMAESYYKN